MDPPSEISRVLIVSENPDVHRSFKEALNDRAIGADCLDAPTTLLRHLKDTPTNLVILDAFPKTVGMELVAQICEEAPSAKIIMITENGDKNAAAAALRNGAFDFLEKPVKIPLLTYSVHRALEVQRVEAAHRKACETLKTKTFELEKVNHQLLASNTALSALAENLHLSRKEAEREIMLQIRSILVPIIEKLEQDRNLKNYRKELSSLIEQIEDLVRGIGNGARMAAALSSSELRIMSLIKSGLSTKAIADHLCISPGTVKTHRRNIRKKLGISGTESTLRDFLKEEGEEETLTVHR